MDHKAADRRKSRLLKAAKQLSTADLKSLVAAKEKVRWLLRRSDACPIDLLPSHFDGRAGPIGALAMETVGNCLEPSSGSNMDQLLLLFSTGTQRFLPGLLSPPHPTTT